MGAIDPDGSSCVSIFTKRSIGTAMYRIPAIFHQENEDFNQENEDFNQENEDDLVDGLTLVFAALNFFSTGVPFL